MLKKKSVLVTGCAGFIGANFVRLFKKQFPQYQIVGIDDFSTGRRDALDKSITFYEGDICDLKILDRIFKKHHPEYVFHFAARPRVSYSLERPTETSLVNIIGTIALLEKSRDYKTKRLIFSSSSSVYGGAKKMPTKEHENPPNPISPYALQKYSCEPFLKLFSDLFGVDTVALRYFNVFGPGQYGNSAYSTVISAWLESLYFPKNKKAFLEGNGTQSRDFCYVDNVVQANIKAMQHRGKLGGDVFNVAHGDKTNLITVRRLIEKYTRKKLRIEQRKPRLGDVKHSFASIDKARQVLGYKPTVTFEEGLRRMVAWFETRKK